MKLKKVNKIKMFNSLTKVMGSNKKIWLGVKEIEKAYKTFLNRTNKINMMKGEYDKDIQNLIDRKLLARKNIITEVFPISNLIVAFAIESNHKKLVKKCNFSKTEFSKAKDLELIEYSTTIWEEAKKLYNISISPPKIAKKNQKLAELNILNYGLTFQLIDKLELANATFVDSRVELINAYEYKKKCGKKITIGVKKNMLLLKKKLDLLMTIFNSTEPEFYSDFVAARTIISSNQNIKKKSKTQKKPKTENNSSSETNQVYEQIKIEVD